MFSPISDAISLSNSFQLLYPDPIDRPAPANMERLPLFISFTISFSKTSIVRIENRKNCYILWHFICYSPLTKLILGL
jgi:hypothetical protein